MKRVFLGGSQSGSKWRDELIPMLKINYSTPVETEHSEEISSEGLETGLADFVLQVVTPRVDNFESLKIISTAVQNSNRMPERAILCVLFKDGEVKFNNTGEEVLRGIMKMVQENRSQVFDSLRDLAGYLNTFYVDPEFDPCVVECLIERDGPTVISLDRIQYKFEKNKAGHYVCGVIRKEHRDYLVKQADFRIYVNYKATEPEFTDEEWNFMREWKQKGADSFLAYMNGHIKQFNESRDKVRAIAIEKWKALLPKMGCPISLEPVKNIDEKSEFMEEWLKLDGVNFQEYVLKNDGRFRQCDAKILEKAQSKWDRIIFSKTGEPWPLILETNG